MLRSGSRIAGTTTMTERRRTARHGRQAATAVAASCAAVPGTTNRGSSARPTANGTPATPGTTISASVSRGRCTYKGAKAHIRLNRRSCRTAEDRCSKESREFRGAVDVLGRGQPVLLLPIWPSFARPALVRRAEEHARAVSLWKPFDLAALQRRPRRVIGLQRHPRQIAGAGRREHGFGPVPDAELAQDALDVELDRAFEYVELARNFLVRFPSREHDGDLALPRREGIAGKRHDGRRRLVDRQQSMTVVGAQRTRRDIEFARHDERQSVPQHARP